MSVDSLHEAQLELLNEIKNCLPVPKTRLADKITMCAITAQFDRLTRHWDSALQNHDKILKKRNSKHAYHTEKVLDSKEDAYYEAKGHFNDLFHDTKLATKASNHKIYVTISEIRL